jgi:predicted nucleotidyltransferase component of viral defense system
VKFDAAQIAKLARDTRFPADNLEKVLRLRELLIELHKHPFLQGRLVLKGGTAINLFYLGLARLSVDIDLNYIGQIDREPALRERPDIVRAVEQIATGLGYKLQNGVDDHALREWYLNYVNHNRTGDRIQIEINFLMRACALAPRILPASPLGGVPSCEYLVLETEELFGGKIKAMIDRRHPRDLYDLYRFINAQVRHNADLLRKLAVLFASTMDRELRTYTMHRLTGISSEDLERLLYPLLRADDRPTAPEMLQVVSPLLATVLDHDREAPYLEAMAAGHYQPELLFPEHPEIVERIRQHPPFSGRPKTSHAISHGPPSHLETALFSAPLSRASCDSEIVPLRSFRRALVVNRAPVSTLVSVPCVTTIVAFSLKTARTIPGRVPALYASGPNRRSNSSSSSP